MKDDEEKENNMNFDVDSCQSFIHICLSLLCDGVDQHPAASMGPAMSVVAHDHGQLPKGVLCGIATFQGCYSVVFV